jgi:hypothetical protein
VSAVVTLAQGYDLRSVDLALACGIALSTISLDLRTAPLFEAITPIAAAHAGAAHALLGRGLADGRDLQRVHADARVVDLELAETAVDHVADSVDREGRLGNVGRDDAFANAVDVSAFVLRDGRRVSVLYGWRGSPEERAFLRRLHQSACKRFGTVLGPNITPRMPTIFISTWPVLTPTEHPTADKGGKIDVFALHAG